MNKRRGQYWSKEEDEQLKSQFNDGLDINRISILHSRSYGAISSRLKKMGLTSSAKAIPRLKRKKQKNKNGFVKRGMHLDLLCTLPTLSDTNPCCDSDFVDLLKERLSTLHLSEVNRGGCLKGTLQIASELIKICKKNNFHIFTEVKTEVTRPKSSRRGVVDFIIFDKSKKYVIEVDSSDKRWSLYKLNEVAKLGYLPIWIRWRRSPKMKVPREVCLIWLVK